MVGKLFKHEIKNSFIEVTIINAIIILIALISSVLISITGNNPPQTMVIILGLLTTSLFILFIVVFVILIVNIIKSFNQKLFSKEGYLTFTIPVTIDQLIFTKILVNALWWFITMVVALFSLLLTVGSIPFIGSQFFKMLFDNINGNILLVILLFLVSAIITVVFCLVNLFFTLCVLNIGKINKAKFILGVLIYYGVSQVLSWITNMIRIIPYGVFYENDQFVIHKLSSPFALELTTDLSVFNFNSIFYYIVAIVALYFIGRRLITHSLELE